MENGGLLEKVNSNYILKNILTYIKDDIIKCQLLKYSKLFKIIQKQIKFRIIFLSKILFPKNWN